MMKYRLKYGGNKRPKAAFGADGALMAAATLTAAGMNVFAQNNAAKVQAQSVKDNAQTQAKSIMEQTANNTALQQENMNFTRQENRELRNQQQELQTTLQLLAGQQNTNDRYEASKVALKYGGRPKMKPKSSLFYGGGNTPFTVTDGGGVLPLNVDDRGYGLYEIFGNDHEHYHKTKNGKYKSGVGIKFKDGGIVEAEGNQHTNNGEKLFITPTDAMFISKHNIAGFNPSKAVDNGMNPINAFNIQQAIKTVKGYNDDGSKVNKTSNKKLKYGGRSKAEGGLKKFINSDYGGAGIAAGANVIGAGLNILGNNAANKKLADAYSYAGRTLANAYDRMHGIDLSSISRDDYAPAHAMAVVRSPNTNVNPLLERIRRNSASEQNQINRNTISSAARQQRLAGTNDRMQQRYSEAYSTKTNADEKIAQENAARIQQASAQNAQLDMYAGQAYGRDRMSLLQYNNNINNAKIAGKAQSLADAGTQIGNINAITFANNATALGSAITASGQGFASAYDAKLKRDADFDNILFGADTSNQIDAIIFKNRRDYAKQFIDKYKNSTDPVEIKYRDRLKNHFGII